MEIAFRPVTMQDAEILLEWRNDPDTRANSHNSDEVLPSDHKRWLAASLENPNRMLRIAEIDGQPVGTVRADRGEEGFELSWTVAPNARGRGIGKEMVRQFASTLDGPLRAEVMSWNSSSIKIALAAGMEPSGRGSGQVICYRRESPQRLPGPA
jgi:UDP-2,4-diacetamido-2,4,6-trideoxy-beta-L-altropyranose hydrolase